ncbi:MAG TPA: type II toxin-antitoxin system VapB family antitoxin [Solirubrobacteraceae bacterium]|jgi:Arc/MetJ family transcription regulator|nr:type II toxin-antitoxin system VapB family antitoxin [Solirubrobacteraceae bacterium]
MARVRTNIEIDDELVRRVMDRYGVHTKTAAVELALRSLAGQSMSGEEALAMRGANLIAELPPDRSPRTF